MKTKSSLLKNNAVQSLLCSLICVILGVFIGYIVLLLINPTGAGKAILAVIKNFFFFPKAPQEPSISAARSSKRRRL